MNDRIKQIVSGGQTGVDRAALDAAIQSEIPHGGWCPKGRRAEDGPLDKLYLLKETPLSEYVQRTEWNVRDSDGTLILVDREPLEGGTALTRTICADHNKPVCIVNLSIDQGAERVREWIKTNNICILNVAGSRESKRPGIYAKAVCFLNLILK